MRAYCQYRVVSRPLLHGVHRVFTAPQLCMHVRYGFHAWRISFLVCRPVGLFSFPYVFADTE